MAKKSNELDKLKDEFEGSAAQRAGLTFNDFVKLVQAKPTTVPKATKTAPGSKEKAIMAAEEKAKNAYRKKSATGGLKDLVGKGPGSKAVKELDALRKSVGWKKSNYGTGAQSTISPTKTKKK